MDDDIKRAAELFIDEVIVPMNRKTVELITKSIIELLAEVINEKNITTIKIGGKRFIREDTINRKDVD